jgi:hypothetical protein
MQATIETTSPDTIFDQVTQARPRLNAFEAWTEYVGNSNKRAQEQFKQTCDNAKAKIADKPAKVKAVKAPTEAKEPKVNDKKVAALRLFEAHPDKNNGAIARMIATELEITYANAYYYVTRVFKR